MTDNPTQTLNITDRNLLTDIEGMLDQRFGQLKEQVRKEIGKATTAGAAVGGGVGMAALGTVLGGLAFVHLIHKVTGMPLWLCYAGSSAAACATGAGLVTIGVRKAGTLNLVPQKAGGSNTRTPASGNGRRN